MFDKRQTHLSLFFTGGLHERRYTWLRSLSWGVNDCGAVWKLTGHFVMLCSHWLMLTLSSRVVHFLSTRSQPQYGSLAPTQALGEGGRTDAYKDTKVYDRINDRRDEERGEKRIEAYLVSEQRNCFLFHMYNVYTKVLKTR